MTVKEFNEYFYPQYNKALSFVDCLDLALQKCDDNAHMQMKVIGWDEDTKLFLLDALSRIENEAMNSCKWSHSKWWKDKCSCNTCFHNCTTWCDFQEHCKKKFMESDDETDRRLEEESRQK